TAVSTSSSAATLPLTMERLEQHAGVPQTIPRPTLPLAAAINTHGTAPYERDADMLIPHPAGRHFTLALHSTNPITAMLTSTGVAGIPAASLVAITLILGVVGLPAEAIGLILVSDRILDMCRTSVNIWGDAVGAVLIARSEGEENILQSAPKSI